MKGEFWCSSCGRTKPDRLLAGHSPSGKPRCVSCEERRQKAKNSNRDQREKKKAAERYKRGYTLPWMFA